MTVTEGFRDGVQECDQVEGLGQKHHRPQAVQARLIGTAQ
jgi:uncharacterized protein YodC (DUF2158 family)